MAREFDGGATSSIDRAGRPSVCVVGQDDGPVVVWSTLGEYQPWSAGAVAGPLFELQLDASYPCFHEGQPAVLRSGPNLRLVAELSPEAVRSAEDLAAALAVFLAHQARAHDILTAGLTG